jgi:hypothetical protein
MGHPQVVALFLIFASVIGIANFAVTPVLSQNSPTPTGITYGSSVTTGYNRTVTIVQTYDTTGFTTSSSLFTQIMVAFVTSTTFFTYVQITFTSSTSTVSYPAPPIRPKPNSGNPLQTNHFSASAQTTLTKYGVSVSLLAAMFMAVFGLIRHKTLNAEGEFDEDSLV